MTMDTTCLYSTVKNISGGAKFFGFLPPHGKRLANNEEYTVFGDIRNTVVNFDRNGEKRSIAALEAAVERGDLEIVSTPAPLLKDLTTGDTKMLSLDNGTLADVDPCWLSSVEE